MSYKTLKVSTETVKISDETWPDLVRCLEMAAKLNERDGICPDKPEARQAEALSRIVREFTVELLPLYGKGKEFEALEDAGWRCGTCGSSGLNSGGLVVRPQGVKCRKCIPEMRSTVVSRFGSTSIARSWCPNCDSTAIVREGKFLCCGEPYDERGAVLTEQSVSTSGRRARPTAARQAELLAEQENRCLYCRNKFGEQIRYGTLSLRVSVKWDHLVPLAVSGDNRDSNFVASCQICNGLKSSSVFDTVGDARDFIAKRAKRGWFAGP